MKILQLISSAGFFGAENVVFELSRELSSRHVENTIGVFENSHNPHIEIYQHAKKSNLNTTLFKCNGKFDLRTLQNIRRFVWEQHIDVIHTHGYKSNSYGFFISKLLRKPIITTCHNWIADDIKTQTYYMLDKFIISRFDKVVAVSKNIESELLRNHVKAERIKLIYNGISVNKFASVCNSNLKKEFNISQDMKIVGTVARFTEEKGLFNLLYASKSILDIFPDVLFLLVGDGPLRKDLEEKCKELGIKGRVIFAGQRNDISAVYSTIDIFVLPSLKEGLPMVILEAMASKKPIIASRVGAIPRVITDDKEGILTSPGSSVDLRNAIHYLLQNDMISNSLATNAYNKVTRDFSAQKMCSMYIELYMELLKRGFGKIPAKSSLS